MKIRLVIVGNEEGTKEQVTFIDQNFNEPVEDFLSEDLKVIHDQIIEIDLPSIFPMNYTLTRSY